MKYTEDNFDDFPHKNDRIGFLDLLKIYCTIWFSNPLSMTSVIVGFMALLFFGPLAAENFKFQYEPADVIHAAFQDTHSLCVFDPGIQTPLDASGYQLKRTYNGKKLVHLSIETSTFYRQLLFDHSLGIKKISNEELRYFDRLHQTERISCQHISLFPGISLDNGGRS